MDKFRDVVLKLSENSTPHQKTVIQQRLAQFLSDFTHPDHPPYAAMIHKAIANLNERGGSTEESISDYIKNKYTALPWAHNSLLLRHIADLCDSGEIEVVRNKYCLLASANNNINRSGRSKKGPRKRKGRGRRSKKNADVVGEQNEVLRLTYGATDELVESEELHREAIGGAELLTPERPPGFVFDELKDLPRSSHEGTNDLLDLEQCEVLPNSESLSVVELPIVGESVETTEQIEEERRKQLQCEDGDPSETPRLPPSTTLATLLPAKHHQQQHQPKLSNSEGLQEGKSKDLALLSQGQKQLKVYSRRKKVKSQTTETKASGSLWRETTTGKQQQVEIYGEKEASESRTGDMVPMDPEPIKQKQLEICREQQIIVSDLDMDTNLVYEEERPDQAVPATPTEPKQVAGRSHTGLGQSKTVRRSQRLAKSKETASSSPCSQLQNRELGEPELQDCGLHQEIQQNPVEEPAHVTRQQAKLRSRQKHNTTGQNSNAYSPDSTLNTEQSLLQVEEPAQVIEQRANLRSHQKQKNSQLNTVMSSIDTPLAQKQLAVSTQIIKQRSKLRSYKSCTSQSNIQTDSLQASMALEKVKLEEQPEFPSLEWHKQSEDLPRQKQVSLAQVKPTCMKLRPRSAKPQSEAAASPIVLSPSSCHEHEKEKQLEHCVRGRTRKTKTDTGEMQQLRSEYENQSEPQLTARRSSSRLRKLTEANKEVEQKTSTRRSGGRSQKDQGSK